MGLLVREIASIPQASSEGDEKPPTLSTTFGISPDDGNQVPQAAGRKEKQTRQRL